MRLHESGLSFMNSTQQRVWDWVPGEVGCVFSKRSDLYSSANAREDRNPADRCPNISDHRLLHTVIMYTIIIIMVCI